MAGAGVSLAARACFNIDDRGIAGDSGGLGRPPPSRDKASIRCNFEQRPLLPVLPQFEITIPKCRHRPDPAAWSGDLCEEPVTQEKPQRAANRLVCLLLPDTRRRP